MTRENNKRVYSHLNSHSETDGNEDLAGMVETAEAVDQSTTALDIRGRFDEMLALGNIFLLKLGDMKETSVGSVEQGNAARQVGAHDPVLGVTGKHGANHDTELTDEPVQVKKGNGRERQAKASDSENGRTAMVDEKGHARHHGGRPDTCPAGPPDGYRVDEDLRLRAGLKSKFRTHGDDETCYLLMRTNGLKESDEVGKLRVKSTRDGIREETKDHEERQMSGNLRSKP